VYAAPVSDQDRFQAFFKVIHPVVIVCDMLTTTRV
jgi:hypothetical protein